ncbi:MAG: response regulator [Nitrospiraceae bacterium]
MRRRLLIVDDEKPVCEMLQDRLDVMGYDCVMAHDGRSALALLALSTSQSPIDGVLLDVQMPVMDGLTTLREIRHRYPSLPVLMMSAGPNLNLLKETVRIGADDFIAKPFEKQEFVSKCTRLFPFQKA